MFWRLQALLIKKETTYGTDAAPTGSVNGLLAQNVRLSPMKGTGVKRNFDRPQFAPEAVVQTGYYSQLTFEVEAKCSGVAGTPPAYGPLFLACKMAQTIVATTSVTYNPHSGAQDSCSIYFYQDGILYKMIGCRGTWKFKLNAQDIPVYEFTMTGLYTQPSSQALPTLGGTMFTSDFQKAVPPANTANTVFTLGGTALALRSLTLDGACEVKPRFLAGGDSIPIVDASEMVQFQVEAPALATFNPFALAAGMGTQAMVLTHGTVAGSRLAVNAPALQLDLPDDPAEVDKIVEWKLSGIPQAASITGNDHFTLVYT